MSGKHLAINEQHAVIDKRQDYPRQWRDTSESSQWSLLLEMERRSNFNATVSWRNASEGAPDKGGLRKGNHEVFVPKRPMSGRILW